MTFLATWVHDWDPVLIRFSDQMSLRWYGLAYVLGFFLGYLLLKRLAARGLWCVPVEKVGDFVTYAAIFGVLLGGRLGYFFFYYLRETGWEGFVSDPLFVFKVWEGGMSSHGGLLGVLLFAYFYGKKNKLPWLGVLDGLALAAPIGIFFGRMANFINGELYGRVVEGSAWAIQFPLELWKKPALAYQAYILLAQKTGQPLAMSPEGLKGEDIEQLIVLNRSTPVVSEVLGQVLSPRYPSQLYEGLAEGAFLFVLLLVVRYCYPRLGYGFISGLFALFYALGRIATEYYREPDAALVGVFTMGQFLSFFLILLGVVLIIYACVKGKTPLLSPGVPDKTPAAPKKK